MSIELLRLRPEELRQAGLSYLRSYRGRGGDLFVLLEDDLEYKRGWGLGDPAVWGDWLEAVWVAKGWVFLGWNEDFSGCRLTIGDGREISVAIKKLTNSDYSDNGSDAAPWERAETAGTYSEQSGFSIFSAFVSWSGWQIEDLTITEVVDALEAIGTSKSSGVVDAYWAEFFVEATKDE